ncbi:succinate dehydrogenase assembly factor 2 [Aquabacter cavernae]|uniref:FAD assembly factor SdhE n=1 Tax=Aquabacter cavernae TaxID=2496029 RepID=UPI000F8F0909|nr:succinate dehydrogenase assembly factor 2 [Aquabacter cavernae]
MTGTVKSSAGLDVRRRRILFRSWHRGTREMDLLMGRFADAMIEDLTEEEVEAFEVLIEVQDPDLFAWINGSSPVPADMDTPMFRKFKDWHLSGVGVPD